jgi:type IV secretory pathway VirB3-like protein
MILALFWLSLLAAVIGVKFHMVGRALAHKRANRGVRLSKAQKAERQRRHEYNLYWEQRGFPPV